MTLPRLNDMPKYTVTIPSTKQRVKFRPYLVKEEKILLLARESNDPAQILNAIADTVIACIDDDIDKNKLTTFDVEYLIVKIRAKSVGETANVEFSCTKCDHQNSIIFNFDDIKLNAEKSTNEISLTDKISLVMKWPSYVDIANVANVDNINDVQQTFYIIAHFIDSIKTETENILVKDILIQEVVEFIESMTTSQYEKLKEFIDSIPKLIHEIKFICTECKHENIIKLEGMNDFF